MNWRTIGINTIESDAGYSILRCTAYGEPTGRFIAFAGRTIPIGGCDSREEAQAQCELHFHQTRQALTA